jgi:hypothetical protein
MRYVDPTGCDIVPANEVWDYYLINFSSNGLGLYDEDFYMLIKGDDDVKYYKLHQITSGENEGNYMAIAQYGKDEETGADIYEYKYVVGKDKVDDFKNGETNACGYMRGLVKLAVDGGVDGRDNFEEKVKKYLKQQYNPLNILFSVFARNPMNLMDIKSLFKTGTRTVTTEVKQTVKPSTHPHRNSYSVPKGTKSNPLRGKEIKQRLKNK